MEGFPSWEPAQPTGHLPPVRALCENLVDDVRRRILDGEFLPGEPINERELVQHYGISRTPVREALKLLQHEGLLTARPHYGMHVTILSPEARREAERLYHLLQAYASKRAALHEEAPLLRRMLEMAQARLRLAHGASFKGEVATEAARRRAA